jgi:cytochrome c-type biogenesis protein
MSLENVLTSISIGLLATTSPCVLPLYPGFLAYLSGSHSDEHHPTRRYLLGLFVLLGVMSMMLALGGLIALLSISISSALSVVVPLADLAIIVLGVLLLLNVNPFKSLPQIKAPLVSHPYANAFVYGLLYGPIALPCSGPLVVGIFAYSLTAGEFFSKLAVFLWFGLGFGLPLLLLSFLSGAAQRWITRQLALHAAIINRVAGVLLIGVAIYDLTTNWAMLVAAFA